MDTLFKDNYLCSTTNITPDPENGKSAQAFCNSILAFVGISSFISGEWAPLSEGLI